MKRTEPKSIHSIIDDVLRQASLTDTFREQQACYLWPEIVGPGVNRYTTRRYVDHGKLHVYISSAPLKSELQFMKAHIARQLNAAVGAEAITEVVIH
jgi:hypothetical protein